MVPVNCRRDKFVVIQFLFLFIFFYFIRHHGTIINYRIAYYGITLKQVFIAHPLRLKVSIGGVGFLGHGSLAYNGIALKQYFVLTRYD